MTDQLTNHLSNAQTVLGLIMAGKQTTHSFSADRFPGEYSKIFTDMKNGAKMEDLINKYGNTTIQVCRHAAQSVNGLGTELDWSEVLTGSYISEIIGTELEKAQKYLRSGQKEQAMDIIRRAGATMTSSQRLRSVTADEISDDYIPFMKSGSAAWDEQFGGFPQIGVVVLAAKWGTGKTTVAISITDKFLKQYPDREVLFVTLEDLNEGFKDRAKVILGNRPASFWKRIRVMEFSHSPDDIIEEAARHENVGLIVIDYLDYLIKGKDLESYDTVYKSLSMGSKSLAVNSRFHSMPILLLAQFGKGLYKGGVPTEDVLPYTGGDKAYQLMMLYNPNNDSFSDNQENPYCLPAQKGYGYIVSWKVKNGCRPHIGEFPGAVSLPWSEKYGPNLEETGIWHSLTSDSKRDIVRKRR